ncbi:MAG: MBL fold metallo-hydrolase [Burkholderiales bacterium]|nr:MBL fold metallo-hydrolase [Burkholderiales bacterium]
MSNKIFSAFLIRHGDTTLLFDTGLGKEIAKQYQQDMPHWQRPFFRYEAPVKSAYEQISATKVALPSQIILSHSHWDHASGLVDFPGVPVLVANEELALIRNPSNGVGGAWPSQLSSSSIQWQGIRFDAKPYLNFASSLDLFGDGRAVLVPLSGHTAGSIGMFVTVDSGKRFFLTGDLTWNVNAQKQARPKFWAASLLCDADSEQTMRSISQVQSLMQSDPALIVLPAHDGHAQEQLGYFPLWQK